MEYADDWQKIISLDFQDNIEELQKVFDSFTTKQLNQFTIENPTSTLFNILVEHFDTDDNYPHFLIKLCNSPNVDMKEVNIHTPNSITGETTLMIAAMRGHLELCKILILNGASAQVETPQSKTAFYNACFFGNYEVAEYLVKYISREELKLIHGRLTIKQHIKEKILNYPHSIFLSSYQAILRLIEAKELQEIIDERTEEVLNDQAALWE
ncbi:hypothetical protein MMC31_007481 [Peltigera leucophlebia]|nr:hypothetical protein [Peltigera leucophlebia]